jgi:hypothetical protein
MLMLVVSTPVFLNCFEEVEALLFNDTAAFGTLAGRDVIHLAFSVSSAGNLDGADECDQKLLVHY